jgi:hypothetical protein
MADQDTLAFERVRRLPWFGVGAYQGDAASQPAFRRGSLILIFPRSSHRKPYECHFLYAKPHDFARKSW